MSLDAVPSLIRARNAQGINITNCDVTTWSWVNLVNPVAIHGSRSIASNFWQSMHMYPLAKAADFGFPREKVLRLAEQQVG